MEKISSFDAKTHFSKLLQDIAGGKEYIITKHNKEVAKLIPCTDTKNKRRQAIMAIKKARSGSKISTKEILSFRDEGKK